MKLRSGYLAASWKRPCPPRIYCPLSLNALTNACNQKSSRDPVSSYDESTVVAAAADLDQKDLLNRSNVGRVPKYEERFSQKYNFVPKEVIVVLSTKSKLRKNKGSCFEITEIRLITDQDLTPNFVLRIPAGTVSSKIVWLNTDFSYVWFSI